MASQGTEAALFGLFRPYILAKFTLGALDKPLFRQFHNGVLGSSHSPGPAPMEHLWISLAEIGRPRVLSDLPWLPHNRKPGGARPQLTSSCPVLVYLQPSLYHLQDLIGAIEALGASVPYLLDDLLRGVVALGRGGDPLVPSNQLPERFFA